LSISRLIFGWVKVKAKDMRHRAKKVGGNRMPRKTHLDAPGTLHPVNARGIERRAIVDDDKDGENFVSRPS
jgi:hypothetical protein